MSQTKEVSYEEALKTILATGQQFKSVEELVASLYALITELANQGMLASIYVESYNEALKIQKELETGKLTIPKSSRETKNFIIKLMRRIRNQSDIKVKDLESQQT